MGSWVHGYPLIPPIVHSVPKLRARGGRFRAIRETEKEKEIFKRLEPFEKQKRKKKRKKKSSNVSNPQTMAQAFQEQGQLFLDRIQWMA